MKSIPKGRPKKPKEAQRTDVLRIRLTKDERAELDAAAQGRSLDSSSWARMILLETARPALAGRAGKVT
jgi:hypothetical protein